MKKNCVWRLHTNPSKGDVADYCRKENVVAMGWSLREKPLEELTHITMFSEYKVCADEIYKGKYKSVVRSAQDVQVGDLVWMRDNGKYYLGRYGENSQWVFNKSKDAYDIDACNQLINIEWKEYKGLDESFVPGAISTAFIRGSTFQRINKPSVFEYSALLYDALAKTSYYHNIEVKPTEESFYSLLTTDDCEDLLCLWLYYKFGYICIPSTNKISTELYECVLLDPKNGKRIYPQVKKGNVDIEASKYKGLDGEVWLLTTGGQVIWPENETASPLEKDKQNETVIHQASATELYEFALSEDSKNILPQSIKNWISFLNGEKNLFK